MSYIQDQVDKLAEEFKFNRGNTYTGEEKLDGLWLTTELRDFLISSLNGQLDELIQTMKQMKPGVNQMHHDLKGQCDFEKINTLNQVIKLLEERKV